MTSQTTNQDASTVFEHLRHQTFLYQPTTLDKDFPKEDWETWRSICRERWEYFTGKAWEEVITTGVGEGKAAEKYPLHINPVRTFAQKHAYLLFGEVPEGSHSLVNTRILPKSKEDAAHVVSQEAEEALNRVYYENRIRSIMSENALLSQFLGGCVFKVGWTPQTVLRPSGVHIERIVPDFFWGLPDGSDMWSMREAWVIQPITIEEAKNVYNVNTASFGSLPGGVAGSSMQTLMVEHWTRDGYRVTIEGKTAKVKVGDAMFDLEGPNPYDQVPFVYIPHERAGGMHGLSIVDTLKQTAKEYNARMADAGDAVREETKFRPVITNVGQGVRTREIAPGVRAFDLGMSPPGGDKPTLDLLDTPRISQQMNSFNKSLMDQMRRDAMVPAVAYGEDEGSQRSALTLAFRMWPLTSHIRAERHYWTEGLNMLAELVLTVLAVKNPTRTNSDNVDEGIKKIGLQHLGHIKRQEWAPILPRDRAELVNELVMRAGAGHISLEEALAQYGDIENIPHELERLNAAAKEHEEKNSFANESENDEDEVDNNEEVEENSEESNE